MTSDNETKIKCAIHDVVINQVNGGLSSANIKLDKLLDQTTANGVIQARLQERVGRIEQSDCDQWAAVNELRKLVYKGIGAMIVVATIIQLMPTIIHLIVEHFGK